MIADKTFAASGRSSRGRREVHAFRRTTTNATGLWYVAVCGARAVNVTGVMRREVTCPRCITQMRAEQ